MNLGWTEAKLNHPFPEVGTEDKPDRPQALTILVCKWDSAYRTRGWKKNK